MGRAPFNPELVGQGEPSPEIDRLAHRVIGAAISVHRALGPGYLESVYGNALAVELDQQGIMYRREEPIRVEYRGIGVGDGRADFLIPDGLIVELKAVESILPIHRAQVLSYLKATRITLGLLINFNTTVLKNGGIHRIIRSRNT